MIKQFLIFVGYNIDFEMPKGQKTYLNLIISAIFLFSAGAAGAQSPVGNQQIGELVEKGDSLRSIYRFEEALTAYEAALELTSDTLSYADDSALRLDIHDKILMSENGRNMAAFADIQALS